MAYGLPPVLATAVIPARNAQRTRSDESITFLRDQRSARTPSHGPASAASTKRAKKSRPTARAPPAWYA